MELKVLLKRIDEVKNIIGKRKPLSEEEFSQVMDYYRAEFTYSTNAMEGNTLSFRETKAILDGESKLEDKPISECYDVIRHGVACDFIFSLAKQEDLNITEDIIMSLHRLLYQNIDDENAGKYKDQKDTLGGENGALPNTKTSRLVSHLIRVMDSRKKDAHPIVLAAYAHRKIIEIQPFEEGNGRVARLLMNLILLNNGYQVASIPPSIEANYISSMKIEEKTTESSNKPFTDIIADCEYESLKYYCRRFNIEI